MGSDNLEVQQLLKNIYEMISKHQLDNDERSSAVRPSGGPTISLTPAPQEKKSKNNSNCC